MRDFFDEPAHRVDLRFEALRDERLFGEEISAAHGEIEGQGARAGFDALHFRFCRCLRLFFAVVGLFQVAAVAVCSDLGFFPFRPFFVVPVGNNPGYAVITVGIGKVMAVALAAVDGDGWQILTG